MGDLLLQAAQPIQDHLFDLGDNQVATLHDYLQVRHHEAWQRGRHPQRSSLHLRSSYSDCIPLTSA
ncbi:MAG: hypothetical protein [Bacteriophage sp.]|nr:MAG: hypothetical protein [Bacteriophage sp.]